MAGGQLEEPVTIHGLRRSTLPGDAQGVAGDEGTQPGGDAARTWQASFRAPKVKALEALGLDGPSRPVDQGQPSRAVTACLAHTGQGELAVGDVVGDGAPLEALDSGPGQALGLVQVPGQDRCLRLTSLGL